jgi:Transposase
MSAIESAPGRCPRSPGHHAQAVRQQPRGLSALQAAGAWRHRPRPICYNTADILVGRTFSDTRVTNARTEAANIAIKHIERTGRGYRNHGHTRPVSCSAATDRPAGGAHP